MVRTKLKKSFISLFLPDLMASTTEKKEEPCRKLDPDLLGGMNGSSISHYLIEMTNFILYNQDLKDPQATLGILINYKQGFNRCQHSIFIEIMSIDYDLPGWLIRILIGYLTGRKLKIKYKSKTSDEWKINGGGGQGCPLGFWIFCFMIDRAGPKTCVKSIGATITEPINKREKMVTTKKKWVDDFTVLASIDLKQTLVKDPAPVRPVPRRGRHEQILPRQHNILQDEVDRILEYSRQRKMVINPIKTKAMLFNPLRSYDFQPQISIAPGVQIDVVEEHKILGQIIRSDLKTISNTENICKKAFRRMWILRRLKSLGCPTSELIDVVKQQIVSICEVGLGWWAPMISKHESNMLERVLKTSLHIVFQNEYISFKNALSRAQIQSLSERRVIQISRFSKKSYKNERFKSWFCAAEPVEQQTRVSRRPQPPIPLLKPVQCRTQRYARSSLPLMMGLLSWHPPLVYTPLDLA